MSVRLTGSHGTWSLPEGPIVIGRGKDCTLCIVDPRLSRHHAKLMVTGHTVVLHDLESTNGVLLNGDRHHGKAELKNGDLIVAGPCTFFLSIDAAQPLSPRVETLANPPAQPTTSPHSDTETMNPVIETPLPGRGSSTDKKLDPAIAALVSASGTRHKHTTDFLRPHDYTPSGNAVIRTPPASAMLPGDAQAGRPPTADMLVPDDVRIQTTSALSNGAPSAAGQTPPRSPSSPRESQSSEGFVPNDLRPAASGKNALQMVPPAIDAGSATVRRLRWQRLAAGALDATQCLAFAGSLASVVAMLGYGFALKSAGAVIEDGLPRLAFAAAGGARDPVKVRELALTLMNDGGLGHAYAIADELYQLQDQVPFAILFATATMAVLVFVLVSLLSTVAATVLKGAPSWHRRFSLVILERSTGHYLGWGRALARWLLLLPLWPMSLILAPMGLPGLHDLISGCEIRVRRKRT
ncbi:MAG TPA: FHA domain-containing protein [Planctomycetota bacterium]|nr:FHA domain-containing protein [Planctomycetota bacterium]